MVQTCQYKKEGQSTLAWDVAVQWPSAPTMVYQEAFHVDLTASTTKIDGCNTFTYSQTPVSTPQTDDKGNKIADKVTNKNTITPLLSDALLTYTFDHIWTQSAEPVPTNIVMLCMSSLTPADMVLAQAAYTAGGKTAWTADASTVQQGICVMSQVVTSKVYSAQPLPPIDASAESDSVSTPTGASAGVQLPPAQQKSAADAAATAALNANCAPEIVCSAMKPCLVAGASIARSDSAFADQAYWRGRAWAPHHMLLYWALARYAHLPAAAAARVDLVALGRGVHELNWGSGVVCENVDGLVGVCEDSGNADPSYHWGALYGFTAFVEGGVY
jgi:hypothetical protein